jgi:general secretion pathway protein K
VISRAHGALTRLATQTGVGQWLRRYARLSTRRSLRPRDRGVALLVVITWLAMMIAMVAEFTFGTSVDAAQAANARDELRAHYMARSAVNLSRLLIKIQQKFVEPVMGQAQKMLQSMAPQTGATGAAASSASSGFGISLRVTDYADLLMGFFSGSKDEVSSLGSLIGLDIANAKGLGMKSGHFDAEITPEDGKIDINCGAGTDNITSKTRQVNVFRLLSGLMFSPRYDRMFSEADNAGQFVSRVDVARALIDWADNDDQMFSPEGASAAEDYHYDAEKDRYRSHDNRYDSLEEIKQVRGVSDEFLEAFGPYLTVYPNSEPSDPSNPTNGKRCRVNLGTISNRLGGDCAPLLMGIIRAAAIGDPTKTATADPAILDDAKLYPLVTILCDRATAGGFDSIDTIMKVISKPEAAVMSDDPRFRVLQGMKPLVLTRESLDAVAYVGAPRTYRIIATGESGKVKKKITAIVDTGRQLENPMTLNIQSEQAAGVLQYWREE